MAVKGLILYSRSSQPTIMSLGRGWGLQTERNRQLFWKQSEKIRDTFGAHAKGTLLKMPLEVTVILKRNNKGKEKGW